MLWSISLELVLTFSSQRLNIAAGGLIFNLIEKFRGLGFPILTFMLRFIRFGFFRPLTRVFLKYIQFGGFGIRLNEWFFVIVWKIFNEIKASFLVI